MIWNSQERHTVSILIYYKFNQILVEFNIAKTRTTHSADNLHSGLQFKGTQSLILNYFVLAQNYLKMKGNLKTL